jgi:hypothetical protein
VSVVFVLCVIHVKYKRHIRINNVLNDSCVIPLEIPSIIHFIHPQFIMFIYSSQKSVAAVVVMIVW